MKACNENVSFTGECEVIVRIDNGTTCQMTLWVRKMQDVSPEYSVLGGIANDKPFSS